MRHSRSKDLAKVRAALRARARDAALRGNLGEAHRLTIEAETVSKLYNPLLGSGSRRAMLVAALLSLVPILVAWNVRLSSAGLVIRGKTRSATTYLAAGGKTPDLSVTGSPLQLSPLASEQSQNFAELGKRLPSRGGEPTLASLRLTAPGGGPGRARPSLLASLAPGAKLGMSAGRDELSVAVFGEALKGAIDVPAGVRVDWEPLEGQGDSKRQFKETEPDVVEFHAQIRRTLPFVVSVRDLDQWNLLAEVERELTFSQVASPANPTVESRRDSSPPPSSSPMSKRSCRFRRGTTSRLAWRHRGGSSSGGAPDPRDSSSSSRAWSPSSVPGGWLVSRTVCRPSCTGLRRTPPSRPFGAGSCSSGD